MAAGGALASGSAAANAAITVLAKPRLAGTLRFIAKAVRLS